MVAGDGRGTAGDGLGTAGGRPGTARDGWGLPGGPEGAGGPIKFKPAPAPDSQEAFSHNFLAVFNGRVVKSRGLPQKLFFGPRSRHNSVFAT